MSDVISNDKHLERVLAARMAAGYPSALQWWWTASEQARETLAAYCKEFQPMLTRKAKR